MPQEREHPFPHVTAEEWQKIRAETPREVAAARVIMTNGFTGIPRRAYLVGDSDHAPILQSAQRFATLVYALLDALDGAAPLQGSSPLSDAIIDAGADLHSFMETPDGL